jgi:hypothetical protein
MAATVTHFKILETLDPDVIIAHHDGNLIVQDFEYDIADQNLISFKRMPAFDGKPLGVSLPYVLMEKGKAIETESNTAYMNIKWNGVEARPLSSDYTEVVLNNDIVNVLSKLPLNDKVEFIKIDSIIRVSDLKKGDSTIYSGQQLGLVNLHYSLFTAGLTGNGLSYFEMYYKVGAGAVLEAEVYKLAFSIDPLAKSELALKTGNVNPERLEYTEDFDNGMGGFDTFNVVKEVTYIDISNSVVNGTANVAFNITADFLNNDDYGKVTININGEETEYIATPIISINENVEVDKNGNAYIIITGYNVHETVKNGDLDIAVDLIDVDGEISYLSGTSNHNHISTL